MKFTSPAAKVALAFRHNCSAMSESKRMTMRQLRISMSISQLAERCHGTTRSYFRIRPKPILLQTRVVGAFYFLPPPNVNANKFVKTKLSKNFRKAPI